MEIPPNLCYNDGKMTKGFKSVIRASQITLATIATLTLIVGVSRAREVNAGCWGWCHTPTPTPTKSPSPTPTRSPSPTPTATPGCHFDWHKWKWVNCPTATPSSSPTSSPVPSETPQETPQPTDRPSTPPDPKGPPEAPQCRKIDWIPVVAWISEDHTEFSWTDLSNVGANSYEVEYEVNGVVYSLISLESHFEFKEYVTRIRVAAKNDACRGTFSQWSKNIPTGVK